MNVADGGSAVVPAQSFLQLRDKGGETATLAVGVKENGKAGVLIVSRKRSLWSAPC
jgi:hypothetical protein